ncbi:MAG: VWA domain-containing protein [Candidatus Aenigmarchaeota archaeon]|nr:VWA domain-containing protein [Candidatus Aenigmarchaeota archaeon]
MRTTLLFLAGALACTFGSSPEAAAQAPVHDNVVIVLDASGSMDQGMEGGKKMDVAKVALREAVKSIPASTHVGLLVFSSSNLRDDWVYPLGPVDRDRLNQAIGLPDTGGGTPLGGYIKKGADALLAYREANFNYGAYKLLVVTDGEATDGNLTNRYVPLVRARGITLDVIGVNMERKHTLSQRVDHYADARNFTSFTAAVKHTFAEMAPADQTATDEAFAALAGLDAGVVQVILSCLTTPLNHPIGEDPPPLKQPPGEVGEGGLAPEGGGADLFWMVLLGILIMGVFMIVLVAKS